MRYTLTTVLLVPPQVWLALPAHGAVQLYDGPYVMAGVKVAEPKQTLPCVHARANTWLSRARSNMLDGGQAAGAAAWCYPGHTGADGASHTPLPLRPNLQRNLHPHRRCHGEDVYGYQHIAMVACTTPCDLSHLHQAVVGVALRVGQPLAPLPAHGRTALQQHAERHGLAAARVAHVAAHVAACEQRHAAGSRVRASAMCNVADGWVRRQRQPGTRRWMRCSVCIAAPG